MFLAVKFFVSIGKLDYPDTSRTTAQIGTAAIVADTVISISSLAIAVMGVLPLVGLPGLNTIPMAVIYTLGGISTFITATWIAIACGSGWKTIEIVGSYVGTALEDDPDHFSRPAFKHPTDYHYQFING